MSEPLHLLLVEDSEDDMWLVLRELRRSGFTVTCERVETAIALESQLRQGPWDIVISDYRLPQFDAPAALAVVQASQIDLPFIVVSGTIGELAAVEMMKAGAHDYLMKGNLIRLPEAVRREVREAQVRADRKQADLDLAKRDRYLSALVDVQRQLLTAAVNPAVYDIILATLGTAAQVDRTYIIENQRDKAGHFRTQRRFTWCAPGIAPAGANPDHPPLDYAQAVPRWLECLTQGEAVQGTVTTLPAAEQAILAAQGIRSILVLPIIVNGELLGLIGFDHCLEMHAWDELELGLLSSAAAAIAIAKERKQAIEALEQLNHELEDRVLHRTAALQQSEAHLREAQQVAHLGSWELEVATRQLSWSEEVFRIFGLDPQAPHPTYEEMLTYFPPADSDRLSTLVEQAIQTGTPYTTDLQIRRTDGSLGDIFARATLSCDAQGQINRLFGIVMDISDRKAIQAALQRSEERARATLLALPDLVFRVNRTGEYLDFLASPTVGNLVNPQAMIGKSLAETLPADIAATHHHAIQQVLASQAVQSYEQQVSMAGQAQYEEIRVAPCGNDEVVFFVRDISDRKRAEAQLQQTNLELARATRLKDEFLASMSHELRTPLTSILGLSEVLQEEIFGKLNEKQTQYVDIILQSGHHLLSLINDILDLAKIESGKVELQIDSTLLPVLCSSSLSFVKQLAHQKNIALKTQLPADIQTIQVDELRMRQALINLLSNAVKFTPAGGKVTLEVSGDRAQSTLQFKVWDTGIGIAAADMPKLFQSFVQIDSSLSRQYNGTGLGLALVKQIVELHQGTVTVVSTVGEGSCFTITLPAALEMGGRLTAPLPPTAPAQSHPEPPRSTLILLADDNPATIDTYSAYLTAYGYQLVIATHGQEAIELAQRYRPDLILMDIQMPGLDGLAATQQIRTLPGLAQIPIIALTALAMSGDREQCLAAGATAYLAKPINLKHLVATIQQLLAESEPPGSLPARSPSSRPASENNKSF